jgi:hypothetical protein
MNTNNEAKLPLLSTPKLSSAVLAGLDRGG